ncbi:hypothetical protein Mapa_014189 [Marchantia paleacea]|nr:hypothetical protein Mapa_014189 [Marchantia paleacea]
MFYIWREGSENAGITKRNSFGKFFLYFHKYAVNIVFLSRNKDSSSTHNAVIYTNSSTQRMSAVEGLTVQTRDGTKLTICIVFTNCLVSGGEIGGVCPGVIGNRVSQVVGQVLDGSLSGHNSLDEEPEHGEHGQPSVLQLLHLQLSEGVWVLSQVQGVE